MTKYLIFLITVLFSSCHERRMESVVLVNHMGYDVNGIKKVVFQTQEDIQVASFKLIDNQGEVKYEGHFTKGNGQVDNWHTGKAYSGDFTAFNQSGRFMIAIESNNTIYESNYFEIREEKLSDHLLPLLLDGFKSQRCKDPYESKDRKMTFYGARKDTVDVSGGWYDASGEKGKYLSHLNFSNYMTPQQLPMMVWNLMETATMLDGELHDQYLAEAAFGADYLVRVQDEEGYFYTTVFAKWTKDTEQREICSYIGQNGEKNDQYQAAFREGGGLAIAALARMAREDVQGEYDNNTYLLKAIKGFNHLLSYNLLYVDDGKENIIDDYCALMAANELYKSTKHMDYLAYARIRSENIINRLSSDSHFNHWLRSDEDGKRPYFHGAEAGLPIIALKQYLSVETDTSRIQLTTEALVKMVQFELNITREVYNPFGYARQYIKAVDEKNARSSFFLPHQNETGYWWQGENARLASLATAIFMANDILPEEIKSEANEYANNQINWILGLNPYNMCMVEGTGYNNPMYKEAGVSYNYKGGVCNGITSGFKDETDIAFMPAEGNDPAQRWRWSEQWLQHGGWLMPAVAYQSKP